MILLKNCFWIESPHVTDGGRGWDILIRPPLIERIEPEISVDDTVDVIDASRTVVVPGFVNTHHHFFQTLTRALPQAQNAKLFDWLVYHYEVWKHIDEEAVRASTMLAVGELLKTGCTTTTDHHYLYPRGFGGDLPAIQFEAAATLGIRFSPSRGSMSLSTKDGGLPPDSVVQTDEEILAESERAILAFHDDSDFSMRRITLAPCSPFSVTPELMRETAALARRHGVMLHTHLAETRDEDEFCLQTFGKRPLALMEDCDYLGPDVYYAHGIFFTDEELALLAKTGTGVSHCPSSNMRLGSGIARVAEMRRDGVPVSIGVDGSASNDTSDYLGEMRNALLLQRVRYGSDAIGARDILEIATEGGARALGFSRVGRIEAGFAADLALFDVHRFDYAGALADPVAALLFAGYSHETAYTVVNGTIVVREGRLVGYDEERLFREGNAAAMRLLRAEQDPR
jgi:cytosine/adenosine deaminase-related metal-dependent hydrolase